MKIFESLKKEDNVQLEERILSRWKDIDILNKTIENRKNSEDFVFYDGPATANGQPGIHHMVAKELKDTFCKYKTMKGYKVLRKVGWDTHGLPVEVNVEKQLGFSGKKDIENYGIEKFNKKCRESVWENEKSFRELTNKMGQFIDIENPYITYDNKYIETEWWILKKYYDQGLLYNGHKITPYCPRCGTSLSSHEVAQEYKEVSVNTVTVPFKVKNQENTYILVWTTTPWTLIANVAACVNSNFTYLKVKSKGYNFIVCESLANKIFGEEYEVVESMKGNELEGLEYEQFLPFINVKEKAFYVVCADYVTDEDGTGIVHIAPAFGQDDYEVGQKYNLPVINPVGEDGKYKEGPWEGRLVVDSQLELDIIKYLSENDKLFKKQKMIHNYPHCWRCKTPLIYYSKPSWYIKTTAYKDKIIEENKKIKWHPSYVGEKRFGNWLENMIDWGISRNRYWGTPLPIWICKCGHVHTIGSIKELKELSIEEIKDEEIDLHRPYVDNIHIKCEKCGNVMTRVLDVIDCWFDSGSMPYAQYHYPFENKELFESQFPADFIAEGIDQTRGWFYTLLVISTFVSGKSSYKNVLVNDLLLDKNGQKMHKSRGNAIEPFGIINKFGADAVRWYIPSVSPVWQPIKFDEDGVKEVNSKFINTLKNTYTFFEMYANTDNIDPRNFSVKYEDLEEIDKWLLSKYNKLIKYVTDSFEEYDLNKVVKAINNFLNEDLSNWYIRRNRRRFWKSDLDLSKQAVYKTTYDVLLGIVKLCAPITPFITDEIYMKLTGKISVHLEDYPECDETKINEKIEEKMDLVRDLISLGRNAREEAKIKVRQPISEVILDGKNKNVIGDLTELIKEELNVKKVTYEDDLSKYMNYEVKPNFKVAGPIFGKDIKELSVELSKLSKEEINHIKNGNTIELTINDKDYGINGDMIEIRINSKDGFDAAMENNNFIILNTTLTDDLLNEGMAREIVSKVQNLRKAKDFDVSDRIKLYYYGDIQEVIISYKDYIMKETLALEIVENDKLLQEYDINGKNIKLDVEKVA